MVLQILILISLMGILVFVIVAPFNPLIFFSIGIMVVGIGIWAIYTLIQAKRKDLAVKLACPSEYNQNNYNNHDNKKYNDASSIVIFLTHFKAIIKRLTTKCK